MLVYRSVDIQEKELIDDVVELHRKSFGGFFLSTLHPGFLRQLYKSFVTHKQSELLVAMDGEKMVGFISYSFNTAGVYRHMLRRYFSRLSGTRSFPF